MTQKRETEYVQAFILANFPGRRVIWGCPLGQPPRVLIAQYGLRRALRMGRGARPQVDALVFEDRTLVLIEAKLVRWLDGAAKLPLYLHWVDHTPELVEYRDWGRRMILATPWVNESVQDAAAYLGVELWQFATPDAENYIEELGKYHSAEYRARRAEKIKTREILGVD